MDTVDSVGLQPEELNLLEAAYRQACRTLDGAGGFDLSEEGETRRRLASLLIKSLKGGERSADVLALRALEHL